MRAKEWQEGNISDLISDCRRLRGDNSKIALKKTNHTVDCHGYNLKKYINFQLGI